MVSSESGHLRWTPRCVATASALVAASVLGCGATESGSGSTSSGGSSDPIMSLSDMLSRLPKILCDKDCPQSAVGAAFGGSCVENYTLLYETLGAAIERSIAKGSVRFDAQAAEACLVEFSQSDCSFDPDDASACERVFFGQVPVGSSCTEDLECTLDAYCNEDEACPGTCIATVPSGGSCTSWEMCGEGQFCNLDGVCQPTEANGGPCSSSEECDSGNCEVDAQAVGTCTPRPPDFSKSAGEQCRSSLECQSGTFCSGGSSTTPTCVPVANLGEPCDANYPLPCVQGTYCARTGGSAAVCTAQVALGGACIESNECAGAVCDGGTCQKYSAIGGPCVTNNRCLGVCNAGSCGIPPECGSE